MPIKAAFGGGGDVGGAGDVGCHEGRPVSRTLVAVLDHAPAEHLGKLTAGQAGIFEGFLEISQRQRGEFGEIGVDGVIALKTIIGLFYKDANLLVYGQAHV